MVNKIFKTGHSAAITLSPKVLKDIGLKVGDVVKIEVNSGNESITIKKSSKESQLPLGLKIRPRMK